MTKRWTLTLLVLAAAAAFSAGRFSVQTRAPFDPARDLNPAHLVSLLGLNEAQAAEVEALTTGYQARVKTACDAHCASRCRLAQALRKDDLTPAQAEDLVERMCASQKQNEMATLEHILKTRHVLTAEQREKFADLVGSCLCESCGGEGATCCWTDSPETP